MFAETSVLANTTNEEANASDVQLFDLVEMWDNNDGYPGLDFGSGDVGSAGDLFDPSQFMGNTASVVGDGDI